PATNGNNNKNQKQNTHPPTNSPSTPSSREPEIKKTKLFFSLNQFTTPDPAAPASGTKLKYSYAEATAITGNEPPQNISNTQHPMPLMLNTTTNTYTDSSLLIFSIDITLISEIHFTNNYSLHLAADFQLYQINHLDNTAHAVRSSLASHPLLEFQTGYIQSCIVSLIVNNIPLSIAAIYCPPEHNISSKQFNFFLILLTTIL
ncbi:putative RNA-directed DNA polymerase, partial [Aphis craccivora]